MTKATNLPRVIKLDEPEPKRKVVKPGLLLLRMATDKGDLDIEF